MSRGSFRLIISMVVVYLVSGSVIAHEFWFDGSPHGPHLPAEQQRHKMDLEFENADAVYVMKCLAKELGYNVLVSPRFNGKVSVAERNVPAEEAFRLVLAGELEKFEVRRYRPNLLIVGLPGEIDRIATEIPGLPEWAREVPVSIPLENMPPALMADFLQHQFPGCKLSFEWEGRVLHIEGRNLHHVRFYALVLDEHFYDFCTR